jgi:hypothetical protein
VDVLSIGSLFFEILGDIEIRLLSWLNSIRNNLKSEGSELFQVDTLCLLAIYLAVQHLLLNVLCCCLEHDMELGFGLQGLV